MATAMTPELYEKLFPEDYIRRCLESGARPDARSLLTGRPVSFNRTKTGSCLVKLGSSCALATVQFAVGTPAIATPDQGELDLQVLLTGVCASKFSTQRTTDEAQSLSSIVSRTLIGSHVVDLRDFSIESGKAAWKVVLTVLFLDHDGNALDTAFLAAMMALRDLRFPAITVSSDFIVSLAPEGEDGLPFPVHQSIVPTTFGMYKGHLLVDPTAQEEDVLEGTTTVLYNTDGEFCGVYKSGGSVIAGETLTRCMKLARARTLELAPRMT
ncbi:exosome complex exonuclease RRP43 [Achlya hypogyna]|uniref:Ribosomal RNA-processing protein 43 n=1 Tax=Achlya hypogyna TaxID=1202772 RepID=A0A1V9Z4X3_ACHHY|nr:exosome complex exonuclease RRP43 [Achlya hypogyna]